MQTREFKEKLLKLLSSKMDEKTANTLAEQVENNIKKLLEGVGNTIELLSSSGALVYDALKDLKRKEMINNISELRSAILDFLNQYLKDSGSSEKIALNLSEEIIKGIQSDKSMFTIKTTLEDKSFEILLSIPDKKKAVDFSIKYDIAKLFKTYEESIETKYENFKEQIDNLLENVLEPMLNESNFEEQVSSFESQAEAYLELENEVSELLEKGLVDIKKELHTVLTNARKTIIQSLPGNLSFSEKMHLSSIKMKQIKDTCDEKLNQEMDKIINKWCEGKPAEVIKTMDFEMIKTTCRFGATLDLTEHDTKEMTEGLNYIYKPVDLKSDDRIEAERDLYQFLKNAKHNRLGVLLDEKLVDMDVSDLRLKDAVEDFRWVINTLPAKIKEVFLEEKYSFTTNELKNFNIEAWQPTAKMLALLKSPDLVSLVSQYARQYEKHCDQLKKEAEQLALIRQQEKMAELNSIATKLDPAKVKAMVDAIKKSNQSMFDLFITKCSLATLQEVQQQATEKSFEIKNPDQYSKFLTKLMDRIKELQVVAKDSPVSKPAFFKAVPEHKDDEDHSFELPNVDGMVKFHY